MSALDRRAFLGLGAAALAGAVLAACRHTEHEVNLGAFAATYRPRDQIAPIGKQAVKVDGVGTNRRDLAAALSPDGSVTGFGAASAPVLRRHLQCSIDDDFARGRLVDVAGWQLPLTEARAAALVYLTR
jgi:hypothetical protein